MEFDPARRVLEALERDGVRYAVFGGVAVNIHGLARMTEDLDLFIAPDANNIERLKSADLLTRLGEAFQWTDLEIERKPFEGLLVDVVTPTTLYRMKKDTVRAKDRIDAEELRRRFKLES